MTETQFQKQCNKILRDLDIPFYHVSSKAAKNCKTAANMPDLIIFYNGYVIAIELKAEGGVLSEGQRKELQRLYKQGVHTRVCFTFDHFWQMLCEFGIVK
jgi:hypothetical protein